MNVIEVIVRKVQAVFKKQEHDLISHNIAGLERSIVISESEKCEMGKLIESFDKFSAETDQRYEALICKYLEADRSKTEDTIAIEKTNTIILPILDKLKQLMILGRDNKIYKEDFLNIKRTLLESLFHKFASADDIPDMNLALSELKEMQMIPDDVSFRELTQHCPVGRWC